MRNDGDGDVVKTTSWLCYRLGPRELPAAAAATASAAATAGSAASASAAASTAATTVSTAASAAAVSASHGDTAERRRHHSYRDARESLGMHSNHLLSIWIRRTHRVQIAYQHTIGSSKVVRHSIPTVCRPSKGVMRMVIGAKSETDRNQLRTQYFRHPQR